MNFWQYIWGSLTGLQLAQSFIYSFIHFGYKLNAPFHLLFNKFHFFSFIPILFCPNEEHGVHVKRKVDARLFASHHVTRTKNSKRKEQQRFGGVLNCFTCHIDRRCKKMNPGATDCFNICCILCWAMPLATGDDFGSAENSVFSYLKRSVSNKCSAKPQSTQLVGS